MFMSASRVSVCGGGGIEGVTRTTGDRSMTTDKGLTFILLEMFRKWRAPDREPYWLVLAKVESPAIATSRSTTPTRK
jgi:hypothetical protein